MKHLMALFILLACLNTATFAEDAQSKADLAVANILFDYDFGSEFATYKVNDSGFVDMTMANNTPDNIYSEILTRMQNHPDIDGVLASKSGPTCKIESWTQ